MTAMDTITTQHSNHQYKPSKRLYIATDGSLKSCITAPLMELPIDFREWPKLDTGNVVLFNNKLRELSETVAFQDYAKPLQPFRLAHSLQVG
jgi:hypothetical protein